MNIKINIGPITENSKYLLEKFKIEQFNDPYQKNNSNLPQWRRRRIAADKKVTYFFNAVSRSFYCDEQISFWSKSGCCVSSEIGKKVAEHPKIRKLKKLNDLEFGFWTRKRVFQTKQPLLTFRKENQKNVEHVFTWFQPTEELLKALV